MNISWRSFAASNIPRGWPRPPRYGEIRPPAWTLFIRNWHGLRPYLESSSSSSALFKNYLIREDAHSCDPSRPSILVEAHLRLVRLRPCAKPALSTTRRSLSAPRGVSIPLSQWFPPELGPRAQQRPFPFRIFAPTRPRKPDSRGRCTAIRAC